LHVACLISLRETAYVDAALMIAADGRDALLPAIASRRPAEVRRGSLDLRRHLFAEDLHLIDQFLHEVRREVEAEKMGDARPAEGVGLVDDLGRRVDVLVRGRARALLA